MSKIKSIEEDQEVRPRTKKWKQLEEYRERAEELDRVARETQQRRQEDEQRLKAKGAQLDGRTRSALEATMGQFELAGERPPIGLIQKLRTQMALAGAPPKTMELAGKLLNPMGTRVDRSAAELDGLQRQLVAAGAYPPPALLAKIQLANAVLSTWVTQFNEARDFVATKGAQLDGPTRTALEATMGQFELAGERPPIGLIRKLRTQMALAGAPPKTMELAAKLLNPMGTRVDRSAAELDGLQRQLVAAGAYPPPALLAKIQIANAVLTAAVAQFNEVLDFVATKGAQLDAPTRSALEATMSQFELAGERPPIGLVLKLRTQMALAGAPPKTMELADKLLNPMGTRVDRSDAELNGLQRELAATGANPPPALLAKIQLANAVLTTAVAEFNQTLDTLSAER